MIYLAPTMIERRQALILRGTPENLSIARPPSYRNLVTWQSTNEGRVRWHVTSSPPYLQRTVLWTTPSHQKATGIGRLLACAEGLAADMMMSAGAAAVRGPVEGPMLLTMFGMLVSSCIALSKSICSDLCQQVLLTAGLLMGQCCSQCFMKLCCNAGTRPSHIPKTGTR